MSEPVPLHVSLIATPGTLVMPIAGLYEVLTAFPVVAAFHEGVPASPPFTVEVVGVSRTTFLSPSGLPLTIERSVAELEQTDIVIVPTMAVETDWQSGSHPELIAWMKQMHQNGAMLCSACTGLALLAETGLLDGQEATTHWAFAATIRRLFPGITLRVGEILVTAGERQEFAMAGGAASWQDLVLYLISRFVSPTAARAIAKFELLQHHEDGQAPYMHFQPRIRHGDSLVLTLQHWLAKNYSIASPVAEMARRSGLSQRAFGRRFQRATGLSPISYVQHLRIESAKTRLEQSDEPIDQISWEAGYEDAAAFRRLFKKMVRLTPGAYRRKFSTSHLPASSTAPREW